MGDDTNEKNSDGVQKEISKAWFFGFNWANRFLTKTEPAVLFTWGAVALVIAGGFGYLSVSAMSGISFNAAQGVVTQSNNQFFSGIFGLPAFLLGIVGTLLPMWAVGRLIADSIKDGAKS